MEELGIAPECRARELLVDHSHVPERRPAEFHAALDEFRINDPLCCALQVLASRAG